MTQLDLFSARRKRPTIETSFREFDRTHPEVLVELIRLAREARRRGFRRIGVKFLIEILRWETNAGAPRTDEWRLDNRLTSRYARKIIEAAPDLADLFETRQLRS